MKHKPTTPQPMQVQDLIAELQRHDPKAKLAFTFPRGGDESGECFIERIPTLPGASRVEIRMNLGCDTFTAEETEGISVDAKVEVLRALHEEIVDSLNNLGVKL